MIIPGSNTHAGNRKYWLDKWMDGWMDGWVINVDDGWLAG
jgi:hypothetical protein